MIIKVIHRISGFIILLAVAAAGGVVLASARSGERWLSLANSLEANRALSAGIGIALLCLVVIYVLSAIPRKKQQKYLSFDAEGGTLSISTAAIADYVARVAGEFPTIIRMRPEVIPAKKSIDIHAYVHIKDGPEIHEVCELLQKRIREVLAGSLGITDVGKVEVSVKEILAEFNPD